MSGPQYIANAEGILVPNPNYDPNDKPLAPSDPYGPNWSGDARVAQLKAAGYAWYGGNAPGASGRSALWVAPDGSIVPEDAALTRVITAASKPAGAGPASDNTPNIGINPATGKAEYFTLAGGKAVFTGVAPQLPNGGQGFAPQRDAFTEDRTGDRVFITNGVETGRIQGAQWASLSPQQQFDQEVAIRKRADDASMARQNAADVASGQRNEADIASANSRAANTEAGLNSRFGVTSQEAATMDRATLAENARQANLRSATDAFGDVTRIAPQLGQLALDNAGFTKDTLSTAPDYLARAFFQQGQTSPLPQVSQADIINQLRSNIQGFNSTLQGFNPQVGAYQAPPAFQPAPGGFGTSAAPVAPPAPAPPVVQPAIAANPYAAINAIAAAQAASNSNTTGFNAGANAAPGVNGFADGGMTRAPEFMVGDSRSGAPTGFEERVVNPTGAPIGVQPMNSGAQQQADPEAKQHKAKYDGISKILGLVDDTALQHALVDEMATAKPAKSIPRYADGTGFGNWQSGQPITGQVSLGAWNAPGNPYLSSARGKGTAQTISGSGVLFDWDYPTPEQFASLRAPAAAPASGAGIMGFQVPQLPTPAAANQADIATLEKSVRPPAINQLLQGGTPGEMQFGFNLFTPNQLGSLSREGRDALGTTLATQFNETVPNVEDAIARRWSTGNRRTAGAVGF